MTAREFLLENLAGDLEYHPKRAALYWALARPPCVFGFLPPRRRNSPIFLLVFALGSLTLLLKGIFLLRKSSEGLGLSQQEVSDLSSPANRKSLPSVPSQAAQVVQDFGAGALLLWPLLNMGMTR